MLVNGSEIRNARDDNRLQEVGCVYYALAKDCIRSSLI
jgi:hypothetical protein